MWERSIMKRNARAALKGHWGFAVGLNLVASIIIGVFNSIYNSYSNYNRISIDLKTGADFQYYFRNFGQLFSTVFGVVFVLSILYSAFVANPVSVGCDRAFLHNHFGVQRFATLFSSFRQSYLNVVMVRFTTNLITFLWSLLLVVPGIIKSLQYIFVSFLLADNPNLSASRARELSRKITDGEKGAIFVLQLSFLLWMLPAIACFVIAIVLLVAFILQTASVNRYPGIPTAAFGVIGALLLILLAYVCMILYSLFVGPYMRATQAELYVYLRDRAIQYGWLNPAELNLVPVEFSNGAQTFRTFVSPMPPANPYEYRYGPAYTPPQPPYGQQGQPFGQPYTPYPPFVSQNPPPQPGQKPYDPNNPGGTGAP